MDKLKYQFLGYVVRCEKCEIRLEKIFDNESDALNFAERKSEFGFSVCIDMVCRAVNWCKKWDDEV